MSKYTTLLEITPSTYLPPLSLNNLPVSLLTPLRVRFRQHMRGDIFSLSSISFGNNVISQHCQIAPVLFQAPPQDSKANLPASNVVPKIEKPLPIQPVHERPNNPFSWKT